MGETMTVKNKKQRRQRKRKKRRWTESNRNLLESLADAVTMLSAMHKTGLFF